MLLVCLQAGEPERSGELVQGPGAAAGSQPTENKTPCHGIAQAFKAAALEAVREYFASSDAAEVARRLEELNEPGLQNIMVKLVRTCPVTPPAHEQTRKAAACNMHLLCKEPQQSLTLLNSALNWCTQRRACVSDRIQRFQHLAGRQWSVLYAVAHHQPLDVPMLFLAWTCQRLPQWRGTRAGSAAGHGEARARARADVGAAGGPGARAADARPARPGLHAPPGLRGGALHQAQRNLETISSTIFTCQVIPHVRVLAVRHVPTKSPSRQYHSALTCCRMMLYYNICCLPQDLALDIPDAAHQLSLFLGRIIVDEALPPSFLTSVLANLRNDSLGVSVVQATGESLGV